MVSLFLFLLSFLRFFFLLVSSVSQSKSTTTTSFLQFFLLLFSSAFTNKCFLSLVLPTTLLLCFQSQRLLPPNSIFFSLLGRLISNALHLLSDTQMSFFLSLLVCVSSLFFSSLIQNAKSIFLSHDFYISSSLLLLFFNLKKKTLNLFPSLLESQLSISKNFSLIHNLLL